MSKADLNDRELYPEIKYPEYNGSDEPFRPVIAELAKAVNTGVLPQCVLMRWLKSLSKWE